jgi:hypothetical protein
MPPRKRAENEVETPESNRAAVEEIEVRWLADSPAVPHRPHEVIRLPNNGETREFLRMGWCLEV